MQTKKTNLKNSKKEKGSISLFVLAGMLFFLIVIFSYFFGIQNKLTEQEKQISEIIKNYDMDITDFYNNLSKDNIYILLKTADGRFHSERNWTNQNLTVEIYYPDDTAEADKLVQLNDGEFTNYTGTFTVTEHTRITAKVRNGKEKAVIAKIDKIAPTYKTTPENPIYAIDVNSNVTDVVLSIEAIDNESGVHKLEYAFVEDDSTPTLYTEMQNKETLTFNSKIQGLYYLWLRLEDNVGNISTEKVDIAVTEYVAKIGDSYYLTLQDAVNACPSGGTIDIIKSIAYRPNTVVPSGSNITINLNGFGITGDGTIIENNGTLTIIDTNTSNTGSITSKNGTVIQNNGHFTLGINDGIVNQQTPTFTGENIVVNTSGTFNYYDGVLIGDKAIEGSISSTPDEYSVISKKYGDQERVYLGVLAESAARIGKWFYNTLDEAIADCPTNAEEATTITVLKNLSLLNKAIIDNGKNIILDLNGYSITNTETDYVIENSATLEILDSTEEKLGIINGVSYSSILNNRDAHLTLSSGNISLSKTGTSSNYISALRNEGEFVLKDFGNIKTTQSSYTYALYNNGKMTTNGGEINAAGIGLYNTIDVYIEETNYKNVDLKNVINNGDYYFEDNGTGKLISNNKGIHSSTAKSYIEIDLTNKQGLFSLEVNAEISSQSYGDYGYAIITEDTIAPIYYTLKGRILYITGTQTAKNYIKDLEGGKKYYLHLGYMKNQSATSGDDILTINSIRLGNYNQTKGELELNNSTIIGNANSIYNNVPNSININNSNIISIASAGDNYGIYNNSIGSINLDNTFIEINSSGSKCYGIYNKSTGIINIKSGEILITTGSYADGYGIYNVSTGIINIGENDKIINTDNLIISAIKNYNYRSGETFAIYNKLGETNFYDGYLMGYPVIGGDLTKTPENTELKILTETYSYNNHTKIFLIESNEDVAEINGIKYKTLQAAIDSVKNDSENVTTIKLLRDITIPNDTNTPIINEHKNICLNINGYTITTFNKTGINNQGTLEIANLISNPNISLSNSIANGDYYFEYTDSGKLVSNNTGIRSSTANSYIEIDLTNAPEVTYELEVNAEVSSENNYDYGYATITENATAPAFNFSTGRFIYISGTQTASTYTKNLEGGKKYYLHFGYSKNSSTNKNNDVMIINSITLTSPGKIVSRNITGIINNNQLKLSNNFEIVSYINSTGIQNKGILELNGTNIRSYMGYAIHNIENGKLTINNAIINSSYCGIYNENDGIININNINMFLNTYRSGVVYGIYNNGNGDININNGNLITSYYSSYCSIYNIYNNNNGNININNISIDSKNFYYTYGIYNKGLGEITMTDGNICISSSSYSAYGIYNNDQAKINIYRGNITTLATASSGSSSTASATGIILGSGELTLGINDETVNKENPKIESLYTDKESITRGIVNNSGIINFYDGIISGTTAISGNISELATGCDIIKTTDDIIETIVLDNSPVAQIENQTYNTLQEAIDTVEINKEDTTVIKLLRNMTILNEEKTIIITNDKKITLDLNGYEITSASESGIINSGNLIIQNNTTEQGIINSQIGRCITNNERLIIETNVSLSSSRGLLGTLYNTGYLELNGGNISNTSSSTGACTIYNDTDLELTIYNGNISFLNSSTGYAIYNNKGDLNITAGSIYAETSGIVASGIYNVLGTINLNGGVIEGNLNRSDSSWASNVFSYGIYNSENGILNMNNGKIKSTSVASNAIRII